MRERDLFLEAIELIDPEARRRFLDRACRGNKALRDGIDRLLAWHERGAGWLEEPLPERLAADRSRDDGIEEPLPAGPADGADGIALRPDDPSVLGRVQILQALPETSFGRVYAGIVADRALPVIVKTLDPRQVPDPQAAGRFLATAWRLATVRHEGLPAVVAVGERPLPWIAFEKVAVESLADRAARGALPPMEVAVRIGISLASALAALHVAGLVHRCLGPDVVLLGGTTGESVWLADAGLAQAITPWKADRDGPPSRLAFLAPEQVHEAALDPLDHRPDLFSLGALLVFLLTGHSPFNSGSREGVLRRVADAAARPEVLAMLPAAHAEMVGELLRADPAERPSSADEVVARLARLTRDSVRSIP